MNKPGPEALFWQIAAEMYSDEKVKEGTIMGFKCLRFDEAFFASLDRKTHALIIKLPKDRIKTVLDDLGGKPFAPAGRVFKEWVSIERPDYKSWKQLMSEAKNFVSS